MSWCDKLFSVPSAGFVLDTHFASGDALVDSASTLLNKFGVEGTKNVTIEKHDTFSLEFSLEDGYKYGFDFNRVYVNFQHRMRFRSVSGGLPVGELLSSAEPYTTMLPMVFDRLIDATLLVPNLEKRNFSRVGIVSSTDVDEGDLPPGLSRFIAYMARPWKGKIGGFGINITGSIDENEKWVDRCIHNIRRNEDSENLMSVKLDWQRTFKRPQAVIRDTLQKEAISATKSALQYFEDVGEGNRFDEEIIATAALS